MKKSFLAFWLLLFTLFNTYANSNYMSYLNSNSQTKSAKISNMSTNIKISQNLSDSPYSLDTTSLLWGRQGGASGGTTYGNGVSADNAGNIYVTGQTNVGLFGQKQNSPWDYFIVKYDTNGYITWSIQAGAPCINSFCQGSSGQGISADNSGNIYVTGYVPVPSPNNNYDAYNYFVTKYDQFGNQIWTKQVGNSIGNTKGYGISTDNSGNIYITGITNVGLFVGQFESGNQDYFVAKYDTNGNLIWGKQVGAYGGYAYGQGVSADNLGNVYVVGSTNKGISGQIAPSPWSNYFIAKYNTQGDLVWTQIVGVASGTGFTYGNGVSADNSGNVYITGYTLAGISGQKQNGLEDYFIAKYDTNSNLIWTKQVGTSGKTTRGYGISVSNSGNIYLTGLTSGGISGQTQNGVIDYFTANYDVNGNLLWTSQVGASGGSSYGYGISTNSYGNIYVTGDTTVGLSGQKQNGVYDFFIAKYTN